MYELAHDNDTDSNHMNDRYGHKFVDRGNNVNDRTITGLISGVAGDCGNNSRNLYIL
jgi:hypothetical protein